MAFDLTRSIQVLERTPRVLESLLSGLDDEWTTTNEGNGTWSPYDVMGHLIHGERTDWMTRLRLTLSDGPDKRFAPFDRLAQFEESRGKSLVDLLGEFATLRAAGLRDLRALELSDADLDRTGIHPKFGTVTARQLLATWVAHDLDHVVQISRVMAHQLRGDVGPWIEFLRVVRDKI
jgi:hypothetical protein